MRLWRIQPAAFSDEIWTGEGAFRFGGRWNCAGAHVVYTSGSLALAALEFFVHLRPNVMHAELLACSAIWPDNLPVGVISPADLPPDWIFRADATRRIGDDWLRKKSSAILQVPSAVVPQEPNYLLNPAHPEFERFRAEPPQPWRFDERMFVRP